jgi:hypothetical protein
MGRDDLEGIGLTGSAVDIKEVMCEGVDWIRLAQDMDQW